MKKGSHFISPKGFTEILFQKTEKVVPLLNPRTVYFIYISFKVEKCVCHLYLKMKIKYLKSFIALSFLALIKKKSDIKNVVFSGKKGDFLFVQIVFLLALPSC